MDALILFRRLTNHTVLRAALALVILVFSIAPAGLVQAGDAPSAASVAASALDANTRNLFFPANSLNFDKTSTIITQANTGLRWQHDASNGAYLMLPRPAEWDGTSDVEMRLHYYTTSLGSGNVSFYVRPRGVNPGETLVDTTGVVAPPQAAAGTNAIGMNSILIPALSRFGTKAMWVITIQRDAVGGDSYAGDVVLMAVELRFANTASATTRVSFPANALNFDKTSTVITQGARGLRWQHDFGGAAFLEIPRPADWDGTSAVELHLHFLTTTATAGNVQWFIRPRAYNPGDTFADAGDITGAAVAVNASSQYGDQVISIPAARFTDKKVWVISMQREGSLETYADDVTLMAVDLRYTRTPPAYYRVGYPANAVNFDTSSTIITQYASGLIWQHDFLNGAFMIIPRPTAWDGTSDVEMRLHFFTQTAASGNVQWFIRPRAFNPGDIFTDAITLSGAAVPVSALRQIGEQIITIPATSFGAKSLWVITMQREGALETYPDNVVLMAVELRFPQYRVLLPRISK